MYPLTKCVDRIYKLVVLGCIIQYSAEMKYLQNPEKSLIRAVSFSVTTIEY